MLSVYIGAWTIQSVPTKTDCLGTRPPRETADLGLILARNHIPLHLTMLFSASFPKPRRPLQEPLLNMVPQLQLDRKGLALLSAAVHKYRSQAEPRDPPGRGRLSRRRVRGVEGDGAARWWLPCDAHGGKDDPTERWAEYPGTQERVA